MKEDVLVKVPVAGPDLVDISKLIISGELSLLGLLM
jgi:hypothetical protein